MALLLSADLSVAEGPDSDGAVYSTDDGGHLWHRVISVTPAPPQASPYEDIAFATRGVGYLAGPAGVAVTTDAGAHIVPVLGLRRQEQVLGLDVTGRSSAVVVTTRRLLVTTDAGRHWQARREPPNLTAVEPPAVDFVSPLIGFSPGCARSQASLYRTVDGGRSWQALAIPAGSRCNFGPPLCVASARVLYYLAEPGPAALYGAGAKGPLRATLYASGDGSWRRVGPAPDVLLGSSGLTLWAYTFGNPAMNIEPYVVFRSRDGGRSFTAVAGNFAKTAPFGGLGGPYRAMTEINGGLETLSAFGPDAAVLVTGCWACQAGEDLAVSVTTDGGLRWSEARNVLAAGMSYSSSSQSVSFVSARVGFVLGAWSQGPGDVLVATSDGGRSWRQLAVVGAGG
jgi:photosystem II stability/assembly factor-like uncharacterized protein